MVARLLRVFGYVLAGLGLFIFIQLPVLADGYWNWWGERPQQINVGYHWVALVVLTVGVAVVLVRCYHHYFEMPVLLGYFSWSMMGLTALVAVVVVVIQMGISGLLVSPTETQNDEIMALIHSPLGLLTLVCTNIVSPVLEELLFRGIVQNTLRRYLPVLGAIMLTNAVFALGHGYQLASTVGIFITGCGFSWLVLKTKQLSTAMGCHILVNWLVTIINMMWG